jgi:hypothetical protein
MFSCFHDKPCFSMQGCLSSNAFNVIKIDFTVCTKLAQVSKNLSFLMLVQTYFALVRDLCPWVLHNMLTKVIHLGLVKACSTIGFIFNNCSIIKKLVAKHVLVGFWSSRLVLSQQKIASDTSQCQNMSFMTWTFTTNVLI